MPHFSVILSIVSERGGLDEDVVALVNRLVFRVIVCVDFQESVGGFQGTRCLVLKDFLANGRY